MIIVKIDAGLGNQMLQYASYVALQKRYPKIQVRADIKKYNFSKIHNGLELERIFPIRLNVILGKRVSKVSKIKKYWHYGMHNAVIILFKVGFNKFCFIKDTGVLNENLFHLDPNKNFYLEGQWGNQKYFKNAETTIREHFTFKTPLDSTNEGVVDKIHVQNSISVHIRRGDYIGVESSFVDLSKSDYYQNAFHFMNKNVMNPVFYIFSNDAEWCQCNLKWLEEYQHYFVKGNEGAESYKDLQLMSLCKHNIIANSTFSWWAGWLNTNKEKIVICPQNLFYDNEKNKKILSEFYPESWIKM